MFRGRFEHTLDPKGRVSLPSKYREVLSTNYDERLIVTNFDGCLWAYPHHEWCAIEDKVASLPQFKPEVKALQRVFISAATECSLDKSGRILLPQTLRDYAGIDKDVVFVGMIQKVEIWAKDRWDQVFEQSQKDISSMEEKLAELGL